MSIYLGSTTLVIHTRMPGEGERLPTYHIERGGDVDRLFYFDEWDGEKWPIDSWATDCFGMINVGAIIGDWIKDSDARNVYVNVGSDGKVNDHLKCDVEINASNRVCCHTHKVRFTE